MNDLKSICRLVRTDILSMVHAAGSGHPGGSLSATEIMVALYFSGLFRCNPDNPDWDDRDRFILSKGHSAPVVYSVLCRKGFFAPEHILTLRKLGSILQGHPHADRIPGMDCSSGSLGQGLSIANGLALGMKKRETDVRVYCLLGDGELQEGQVWEAALTSAQLGLDNVCAIVDNNHVQLDGFTADIKKMEPVGEKFRAFGWNVISADGHDTDDLIRAYKDAMLCKGVPSVIVAECVKGKGVSFMENDSNWHGLAPNDEQLEKALAEVNGGVAL